MFPPSGGEVEAREIELNGPSADEFMVLNDALCPRLGALFKQVLNDTRDWHKCTRLRSACDES